MDFSRLHSITKRIQLPSRSIKSATNSYNRSSSLNLPDPSKYLRTSGGRASSTLLQQKLCRQLLSGSRKALGTLSTTKSASKVSNNSHSNRLQSKRYGLSSLKSKKSVTSSSTSIASRWRRERILDRALGLAGGVRGVGVRFYCSAKEGTSNVSGEKPGVVENVAEGGEKKVRTEPPKPSLLTMYMQLAKARLGAMVVLSTVFGFFLAPGVPFDAAVFASTVIGTSFTVASANSINQYLEVEYDSMMKRTKNRPLPAGHMSLNHALAFGVSTGAIGTVILGTLVNPLCATLAFSNIILYTLVYTPMKRVHPLNTAVGAIVGAIPPLIGWAAQTGGLEAGAWVSFLVMALWQMPHFHALSWPLRFDYGSAGYRMLANVSPDKVPIHVLLYTVAALGLGPFASFTGLASWHFALLGSLPTLPWIYYAYRFYKLRTNPTARDAFKWSLYWLPLFFALLCFSLSPDRDVDTIEEDVIAIHQSHQLQQPQQEQ